MCWTNAFSLTTPLFLCTVFMTYMFSEQYNRQHANHSISPQLSDHSKQQLLLVEGRREQDKQRNKQSSKVSGKEASKNYSLSTVWFLKASQYMTVPMASCNAVSTICSHYGCQGMCEVSLTHHEHLVFIRQELALIKMITFWKKVQTVNDYFSVTSQHKRNIRLYKRYLLTSTASILTSMHFSPLASHLYFHVHPTVTPSFILSFHLSLFHTTSGKVQNIFT